MKILRDGKEIGVELRKLMNKLVTLAEFDNYFDVKYNLLKSMLEEAGIDYISNNENMSIIEPVASMSPSSIAIEIKIYDNDWDEANEILKSLL